MSLINTLLTGLETRHAQKSPAKPRPSDFQHLQAVPPEPNNSRRRRLTLIVLALISSLAAAWAVFFPDAQWNWTPWNNGQTLEVLRDVPVNTPSVTLLSDSAPPAAVVTPLAAPIPMPPLVDKPNVTPMHPVDDTRTASIPNSLPNNFSLSENKAAPLTPPLRSDPVTKIEDESKRTPISTKTLHKRVVNNAPAIAPPGKGPPLSPAPTTEIAKNRQAAPVGASITTPENSQIDQDARAQNLYKEAKLAIKKGFYAQAEQQLRNALESSPNHVAARGTLAGLLIDHGRWLEAEHLLNAGLKINPQEISLMVWQARVLVEQGAEKQALQLLEEAPESALKDAEYCGFLATLYTRANHNDKAIAMYRNALGQRPTEGKWWVGLASVYEKKQNYRAAIDAYARGAGDAFIDKTLSGYARERIDKLRVRLEK
ncbi:MAG: tetratricopeptide repeat protein [Pseudomonadota bacterium]